MNFGPINIDKPIVLAPKEDVTDIAFRLICRRPDADVVYTEFTSSEVIIRKIPKVLKKIMIEEIKDGITPPKAPNLFETWFGGPSGGFCFAKFGIIICFCLASLLTIKTSWAEIIELKSGRNIKGPILMRVNDYVKVDMGNGIVVTYYLDEIKNIIADSKNSAEFDEYQTFLDQQLEQINRIEKKPQKEPQKEQAINVSVPENNNINIKKVEHQIKDIESTVVNLDKDFPIEFLRLKDAVYLFFVEKVRYIKLFFQVLAKLASLKIIIENILPSWAMILFTASWLLACYPTMIFAKKYKEKLYWMAWIPILQIYLLVKLADKPFSQFLDLFSPLIIVLLPFLFPVPYHLAWFFVGIFILLINFLIFPTLLWCRIIRFMDQPAWLGIGTLIPIINVIVINKLNNIFFQPKEQYSNRISQASSKLELIAK